MKRVPVLVLVGGDPRPPGRSPEKGSPLSGRDLRGRPRQLAGRSAQDPPRVPRQDRYNVHGGQNLDSGDVTDSRFGSVEARGAMDSARLVVTPGLVEQVIKGEVARLEVTGMGKGLVLAVAAAAEEIPLSPAMTEKKPTALANAAADPVEAPPASEGFRLAYATTLGARDWVDSNGVPLYRLRGALKQDRANLNRLDQADAGDERDPIFNSASERRKWDSLELSLDPAMVGPLSRREVVKVIVLLPNEGDRALVTRPEAESLAGLETIKDLLASRQWKVEVLVTSSDPGVIDASRDFVRVVDLLLGRDHLDTVLAGGNLATRLFDKGVVEEVKPMLEEFESDFRAAASCDVDPASIVAVMGFHIEAHSLLGGRGSCLETPRRTHRIYRARAKAPRRGPT